MKTNIQFCSYLVFLLRMKNVSDKSRSENRNAHFSSVTFFCFENRAVYETMVGWVAQSV
jgi:hypothetical protein